MVELQQFQQAAKSAVYQHFRTRSDNPLVVIPAGGGTTSIIASICDGRCQVGLSPVGRCSRF